MTLAILIGVGLGGGLWLVLSGLAPSPEPLDKALARIGRPLRPDVTTDSFDARLGAQLRRLPVVDRAVELVRADLRVLRRDADEQAAEIAAYLAVGFLWAPVVGTGMWLLGVRLPLVLPLWFSVAGAAGALVLSVQHIRARAKEARAAFTHALSAYCDVVSMSTSAGYELHSAVFDAATRGDGWAFGEIRGALHRGFLAGERPWDSLAGLGRDLGVNDLVELGAMLSLAGDEGTAVGDTLTSKARSIRERLVADTERHAAAATERMAIPGAMVLIGFLWLLAFPALHLILEEARR